MLIRRLALSGDYADTDWTNPSNAPPDAAALRRVKATQRSLTFAIEGKDSTLSNADLVDVGSLAVDAWLGTVLSSGGISRNHSIVEVKGSTLSGRIMLVANDVVLGSTVLLNLALTSVGALAAVDVLVLSGGRPL